MALSTTIRSIGHEGEPLAIIEDFAGDPDFLRKCAVDAVFSDAGQHYPGIRAPLPDSYLAAQLPGIAQVLNRNFSNCRRIRVVDASFSMVTQPPAQLRPRQRVPHADAYGEERIALVHYLSLDDTDGTAFFRHRSTGYETIDVERAPAFFARLDQEMHESAEEAAGYLNGDTPLFERIALVPAQYNRAVLYRSYVLHSGAISPSATLSADPARGRLTVTGFFSIE